MSKQGKIALIITGILSIVFLFLGLILPGIIKTKAIEAIREATGRIAHIEKVSINPFNMTASVRGLAIEGQAGSPFINIGNIRASLSPTSLYKRALVLSQVAVTSPSISIVRSGPGQYSFTDILTHKKEEKKPKSTGLFPFFIHNISITDGSLDLNDQAVAGGRIHTIRRLAVQVPFISTVPAFADQYINPRLSAVVNGAALSLTGRVRPFSKSQESTLHFVLKQLKLPELLAYAPQVSPVKLQSGRLTLDAEVSYHISADQKPSLAIKGLARLEDVDITRQQGQPLAKLALLEIQAARLEIFTPLFEIESITLDRLEMFISRNRRGEWMHDRLLSARVERPPQAAPEKKPAAANNAARPVISIGSLALRNGKVHVNDALPQQRFIASVSEIDLSLKDFTNLPGKLAEYALSLRLDGDSVFSSTGSFSTAASEASASVKLTGLNLQKGWPYLARFLTAPLQGSLDLSGDVAFRKESGVTAQNGSMTLAKLATRYGENEGLELAQLAVRGVTFKQKGKSLEVASIKLSQGDISLSREAGGKISLQSLLRAPVDGPTESADASPSLSPQETALTKNKQVQPLAYRIKSLELDKFHVAFMDKSRRGNPQFSFRDTSLSLSDIKGPEFMPIKLRFSAIFGEQTPLNASGELTPLPFRYRGDMSIKAIPIRDFDDYFPENLNVSVLDGSLDTALNLDIVLNDGSATGSFQGSAGISAFHAIDAENEEDLLKWERLQLDDIQGNLQPFNLAIGKLALNRVYSRIIVRKDGTLNLQHLVKNEQASGNREQPVEKLPKKPEALSSAPPPIVASAQGTAETAKTSIGAVTVLDGTISFTDNHLAQQYATTFYNLGGRVSGLSSAPSILADVDLRGNLENHSPLQITGKINPLRDDLFIDLKVSFKDIELSPLTPYASTYLGYTVEKGKLFLDLKYHIEKKQLNSDNKILIDQFTLGSKVASDKATNLPVTLGLALLKDRRGEINLDVPVTGRTDDPQFDIWRLVFQVLRNLLVKAVTSPLTLFSSLFGSGNDLSTIVFAPGTAVLQTSEEQKLSNLAKGLIDRPALKMELMAYVDPERDPEGYRAELLQRKVRNEKFLDLTKKGQMPEVADAESMDILPDEYSKYLRVVYGKEKFPKPRNAAGLVIDLPDSEMSKLIIVNTMVGNSELQTLARERVLVVVNYLIKKGNVPSERIFQKNDDIFKIPNKDKTARSRLELNALAQ